MGAVETDDVARLFEEFAEPLFAFLVYRTGSRAQAEDLVGETFERVLRGRRRFSRRRGTEKSWVFSIALNLLRDSVRRSKVEVRALRRLAPGAPQADQDTFREAVGARDAVVRAVAQLPEAERQVVALRFGADLTVPEISRLTGDKLTTVEGRLYRAQATLRGLLGD
jgi:RNA polymerase sigma-70 factor (ECF subfamily)